MEEAWKVLPCFHSICSLITSSLSTSSLRRIQGLDCETIPSLLLPLIRRLQEQVEDTQQLSPESHCNLALSLSLLENLDDKESSHPSALYLLSPLLHVCSPPHPTPPSPPACPQNKGQEEGNS